MTPAQFAALTDRLALERERADYRAGVIAATLANVHRSSRARPYRPEDFFHLPSRQGGGRKGWQQHLALVEMLNAAFGGRDLRKKGAAG